MHTLHMLSRYRQIYEDRKLRMRYIYIGRNYFRTNLQRCSYRKSNGSNHIHPDMNRIMAPELQVTVDQSLMLIVIDPRNPQPRAAHRHP